jgi:hypothetical protein
MSAESPLARAVLDALRSDPDGCAELRGLLNIEPPQPAPQDDGCSTAPAQPRTST